MVVTAPTDDSINLESINCQRYLLITDSTLDILRRGPESSMSCTNGGGHNGRRVAPVQDLTDPEVTPANLY